MKTKQLFILLTLGLGLALGLLWLLDSGSLPSTLLMASVAQAQSGTGVIRVATTGVDTPGCGGEANPCRTVQYAVDQAQASDEIRVAAGTYTGITHVVYISKTVTIRGGYTTTNWTTSDPVANPTTLDAQGQGRVLYITGNISPTIEGLRITGGNAAGLGGTPWGDAGGGAYINGTRVVISNNWVFSNTAYLGGGLWLYGPATLSGNIITANTAGHGGGLGLYCYSAATLSGNTISYNTANSDGGGLLLCCRAATLNGNTVTSNTASEGGGLYLQSCDATLTNNVIANNRANTAGSGLYIESSSPHLLHTTIARNSGGDGSGVYVTNYESYYSTVALTNNILVSHTVGIIVRAGNTATLEATLWWANGANGVGVSPGPHDVSADPAFVDPDSEDYHIGAGSPAIDAGVDAGVNDDIDGDPRPQGSGYDIGADEFVATGPESNKVYLPLVMKGYCGCGPDNYEPNDSFDQAYGPLTSGPTYQSYISCCDVASRRDYFYIDISTTNAINIDLTNIPLGVDYDLYLYNSAQTEVGQSQKDGNAPEHISYNPLGAGRYYILVFSPYSHYSTSPYSLRVTYD